MPASRIAGLQRAKPVPYVDNLEESHGGLRRVEREGLSLSVHMTRDVDVVHGFKADPPHRIAIEDGRPIARSIECVARKRAMVGMIVVGCMRDDEVWTQRLKRFSDEAGGLTIGG